VVGQAGDGVGILVPACWDLGDGVARAEVQGAGVSQVEDPDAGMLLEPIIARGEEPLPIGGQVGGRVFRAPELLTPQVGADDAPAGFADVPGQEHPLRNGAGGGRGPVVSAPATGVVIQLVGRLAGIVRRQDEPGGDGLVVQALPGVGSGRQGLAGFVQPIPAFDVPPGATRSGGHQGAHHQAPFVEQLNGHFTVLREVVGEGEGQRFLRGKPFLHQIAREVPLL